MACVTERSGMGASAHAVKITGKMPVLRKEVSMSDSNKLTRRGFMQLGAGVVAAAE